MRKEIVTCDICGSDKDVLREQVLPVFSAAKRAIRFRKLDICQCCLIRSTNIREIAEQGLGNDFILKPNSELNK